ncbi:MAG: hypothetical protein ACLQVI_08360 [Polyangiaceae bacterium]
MRVRPLAGFAVLAAAGLAGACSKSGPPGETVASSSNPPFVVCYEPDGAPCPLDAGEDGGEDGGALVVDASDAAEPPVLDACLSDRDC